MIQDTKIFVTKWPLFEIRFEVWKFGVATALYRPSPESMAYEYIRVQVTWGNRIIYHFRLWDTMERVEDRLGKLINSSNFSGEWSIEKLEEIRREADSRISKIKKGKK